MKFAFLFISSEPVHSFSLLALRLPPFGCSIVLALLQRSKLGMVRGPNRVPHSPFFTFSVRLGAFLFSLQSMEEEKEGKMHPCFC